MNPAPNFLVSALTAQKTTAAAIAGACTDKNVHISHKSFQKATVEAGKKKLTFPFICL